MAKDCADCGLEDCGLGCAISRALNVGPPQALLSSADSESARTVAQNGPRGGFGDQLFEADPGPAQLTLRVPEAIS
eukprot:11395435-Alexandrium_andersonii.AAC.1